MRARAVTQRSAASFGMKLFAFCVIRMPVFRRSIDMTGASCLLAYTMGSIKPG